MCIVPYANVRNIKMPLNCECIFSFADDEVVRLWVLGTVCTHFCAVVLTALATRWEMTNDIHGISFSFIIIQSSLALFNLSAIWLMWQKAGVLLAVPPFSSRSLSVVTHLAIGMHIYRAAEMIKRRDFFFFFEIWSGVGMRADFAMWCINKFLSKNAHRTAQNLQWSETRRFSQSHWTWIFNRDQD